MRKIVMLVSVIVPVYNTKKYLTSCLDSIINQTYSDLEIILVDDGSTDGSAEICDRYEETNSRVRVIHQKNSGCIYARFAGLQNSKGDYIGFVDSDDWIAPDFYQVLMSAAEEKNCDIVSMGYTTVYGQEQKEVDDSVFFGLYEKEKNLDNLLSGMMYEETAKRRGVHPALWSKVIKRKFLMEEYAKVEENITLGEDAAIFYPCCLKAERIFILREYQYYYRIHEESMCRSMDINTIFKIHFFDQHMRKIFSKYEEKYCLQKQLKKYLWTFVFPWLQKVFDFQMGALYLFPYSQVEKGEPIILYGAGKVGEAYYSQICENRYCNIVAWADKAGEKKGKKIIYPDQILGLDYSKLVIAVRNEKIAQEMMEELLALGIEKKKIAWSKPQEMFFDFL